MNSNNDNTDDIFNVVDKDYNTSPAIIRIVDQSPTLKLPDSISASNNSNDTSKINLDDAEILSIERLMTNPVNLIQTQENEYIKQDLTL